MVNSRNELALDQGLGLGHIGDLLDVGREPFEQQGPVLVIAQGDDPDPFPFLG
jgi:hypothetical protein